MKVVDAMIIVILRMHVVKLSSSLLSRLSFFRHDVWRYIAEPAMSTLKANLFEEVKLKDALSILNSRQLGFSQIRLLPKTSSVRPIMNLRRRAPSNRDKNKLGPSINSILGPVHSMFTAEKVRDIAVLLEFITD